jgi:hypothetical protein
VSRELRETIADWLMLIGAVVLLVSLFLTWSHQLPPAFRRAWPAPALAGVAPNPTAWQVYSIADVCLALTSAGLVLVAFVGTRRARVIALAPVVLALVFVLHAAAHPPTNGLDLHTPPPGGVAVADRPASGFGETLATAGLAVALAGLALSFTAD